MVYGPTTKTILQRRRVSRTRRQWRSFPNFKTGASWNPAPPSKCISRWFGPKYTAALANIIHSCVICFLTCQTYTRTHSETHYRTSCSDTTRDCRGGWEKVQPYVCAPGERIGKKYLSYKSRLIYSFSTYTTFDNRTVLLLLLLCPFPTLNCCTKFKKKYTHT